MTTRMITVEHPDEFRKNISNKVKQFVNNKDSVANNIEKSIYNYSISECDKKNIIKNWNNVYFVMIYLDKFKSVYYNLKNNNIYTKIKNKEIKSKDVAFMNPIEFTDEWSKIVSEKRIDWRINIYQKLKHLRIILRAANVNLKNALIINYKRGLLMNL